MHASCATTWTTFLYCNLYSWNLPLMATLSLLLDHLKVDKLSKNNGFFYISFLVLFYIQKMWTLLVIFPIKTMNTWLWSVLLSIARAWTVYWKMIHDKVSVIVRMCLETGYTFVIILVTGLSLSLAHDVATRKKWKSAPISITAPSEGGGLWWYSTLMMYVNTNVKTQKHILSFYYYNGKIHDFLS